MVNLNRIKVVRQNRTGVVNEIGLCIKRQTTSEASSILSIIAGYQSKPYSIPCVPFLSEERNDLSPPALALFKRLLNSSASSASLVSWLINTKGLFVFETTDSVGILSALAAGCVFFLPVAIKVVVSSVMRLGLPITLWSKILRRLGHP